jgi:glycosyltransferase involved in cell wall biosynthesis
MTTPSISVVLATYNGCKYLSEQLNSIVQQLDKNDELIIVDDASSDETVSIIFSHLSENIRILSSPVNSGPISTFERGITATANEIIVLSDQDDIWFSNRLEIVRLFFANPSNPSMLSLDSITVDANFSVICTSTFSLINADNGIFKNIIKNRYIGCHLAFRKEILHAALPFPAGIPMHDIWLGLIAELFYSSYFLRIPTMYFRRHESNYTPKSTSLYFKISWRLSVLFHISCRYCSLLWCSLVIGPKRL